MNGNKAGTLIFTEKKLLEPFEGLNGTLSILP